MQHTHTHTHTHTQLINKDIENLDFIALLKPTTIQVTGNVITQETFLGTLKVDNQYFLPTS